MEKSNLQTSRKLYAMRYGMKFVGSLVAMYVLGKALNLNLETDIFIAAIISAGTIITALNIADGMKGHEP